MEISNTAHYSSDAYLQSKKQYEIDHKSEFESEDLQGDLTTQKLEDKNYSQSVNTLQPLQVVREAQSTTNDNQQRSSNTAAEKAVASYNQVENNPSTQESFNQVRETV